MELPGLKFTVRWRIPSSSGMRVSVGPKANKAPAVAMARATRFMTVRIASDQLRRLKRVDYQQPSKRRHSAQVPVGSHYRRNNTAPVQLQSDRELQGVQRPQCIVHGMQTDESFRAAKVPPTHQNYGRR